MPKLGKTPAEWRKRLDEFARGIQFGRGERPRKGSVWAKELAEIEKCPRQGKPAASDLFGNRIVCSCGHHEVSACWDGWMDGWMFLLSLAMLSYNCSRIIYYYGTRP